MLAIILLLTTVEQFCIDVYLPSMPAMSLYFNVSDALVQFSLSIYLIGFALSPLICGPITDRFGRRRVILSGLVALTITSLLCAVAQYIEILLLARFLMGLSCGFIVVANQSMVRDSFQGNRLIRVASYMSMTWSLVPIIAPALGGYLQSYFGWQSNFYAIALYSFTSLLYLLLALKESLQRPPQKIKPSFVIKKYGQLLRNRNFMIYVICTGLNFAVTTAFVTAAPFLFQDTLGFSPVAFGWLSLAIAFSYLIGTYLNTVATKTIEPQKMILFGILLTCGMSTIGLLIGELGILTAQAIAIPASIIILAGGFIYPNAAALAFEPITKNIGLASALYISLQLLCCAMSSAIVAKLPEHNQIPIMSFLLIANLLIGIAYLFRDKQEDKLAAL